MKSFLARHESDVKGVLSGFDRVRFRGTLRLIANLRGLSWWLSFHHVLDKSFKDFAGGLTDTIQEATQQLAAEAGRPLISLPSSSIRKEDFARDIAQRDGITSGLVCVLTAVEPCKTFTVGPNRETKLLELRSFTGKCLHQDFSLIDPQLGWLNVRLQTWLPFTVHVVTGGREWLSRDLHRLRKVGQLLRGSDRCLRCTAAGGSPTEDPLDAAAGPLAAAGPSVASSAVSRPAAR